MCLAPPPAGHSPADDIEGAQTVSLVAILPAVDVFLLHPPVVVNGGTHPLASTPAVAAVPNVDIDRKTATGALISATPDQVATPDVLSPEGKSRADVEGMDNGNYTGQFKRNKQSMVDQMDRVDPFYF